MPDEKIDPQLNLSLALPSNERMQGNFSGYNPETNTWEIIIKFNGNLIAALAGIDGIENVAELSGGFAVLLVQESAISQLAARREIIYIDQPKALYFTLENGIPTACIPPLWNSPLSLTGLGTIACIIDSGIDYTHPDFRTPDGKTRILAIWDQTIPSGTIPSYDGAGYLSSPEGYFPGTLFLQAQINAALGIINKPQGQTENTAPVPALCPVTDASGHGTHVAGICAGNGAASGGRYRGCAYEANLLIVKLGRSVNSSYPTTTQLMQAADWAVRFAVLLGLPIGVNISFGNNYGAHDGSSLIEQFLDRLSEVWKCMIVVGTGNEGSGGIHFQTKLSLTGRDPINISCRSVGSPPSSPTEPSCPVAQLSIAPFETSLSIQIWKQLYDEFELNILPPSGNPQYRLPIFSGIQSVVLDRVRLRIYYSEPSPFQEKQEIFIEFSPVDNYLTSGTWRFLFRPIRILDGTIHAWLPSRSILNSGTRFLNPSEEMTFTIPSTASKVLSVAAYDQLTDSTAWFSGRGYVSISDYGFTIFKPELSAPGVSINAPAPGGGYTVKSGTSMATPFVTGTCLLLMQWGIAEGRDPFLYGQKLKDYLISGTKALPVFSKYPNSSIGYGTVCAQRSVPDL